MATISIDVIKMRQVQDKNGHVLMVRLNPADEKGVAAVSLTPCGAQFRMELSDLDDDGNPQDVPGSANDEPMFTPATDGGGAKARRSPDRRDKDAGEVRQFPAREAEAQPTQDKPVAASAFRSFSLAQRIAALCTKPVFHQFLADVHADRWRFLNKGTDTEKAAIIVRSLCDVKSRADIETNPAALVCWMAVARAFDQWQSQNPF